MRDRESPREPLTVRGAAALVMRWLAGRDLTIAEIRTRLKRRECAEDVAAEAIARLQASGIIDDQRVAISRARTESASRGRGRHRVLLRLRSIGIDADTARRALETVYQDVDEASLLTAAVERRLKQGRHIQTPVEYRRIYAALVRQGFAPADVRKALDSRRAKSSHFTIDDQD